MISVKVSELKSRLSHYLRAVRRGETVIVCDRDRVVARIEAAGGSRSLRDDDSRWLDELERRGTIRRARRRLGADWFRRRPAVVADVVGALLDERDQGR